MRFKIDIIDYLNDLLYNHARQLLMWSKMRCHARMARVMDRRQLPGLYVHTCPNPGGGGSVRPN